MGRRNAHMSDRLPSDHEERLRRAQLSLDGLWVGDSLGQKFFYPSARMLLDYHEPPNPPWPHTDDTEMALAILEVLEQHGAVNQDELAWAFARRYRRDPARGYGGMAHTILSDISAGTPWRDAAVAAFDGEGSMGNGGAMRIAPVGAYFADDLARAAHEARLSAEVTHLHPEGVAGAVAVAVAAAWAWRSTHDPLAKGMLETVLDFTPAGETNAGIERALTL